MCVEQPVLNTFIVLFRTDYLLLIFRNVWAVLRPTQDNKAKNLSHSPLYILYMEFTKIFSSSDPTTQKSQQTNILDIFGQPRSDILPHLPNDIRDTGFTEIPTKEVIDEILDIYKFTEATGISVVSRTEKLYVNVLKKIGINVEHVTDPTTACKKYVHVYIWPSDESVISTECVGIVLLGDYTRNAALRIIDHPDWQPYRIMAKPSISYMDCKTPDHLNSLCKEVFKVPHLWHSIQRSFIPKNETVNMGFGTGVFIRDDNRTRWIVDFVDMLCRITNMECVVGKSKDQIETPFLNYKKAKDIGDEFKTILDMCKEALATTTQSNPFLHNLQLYLGFLKRYNGMSWHSLPEGIKQTKMLMQHACGNDDERKSIFGQIIIQSLQEGIQLEPIEFLKQ